MRFQSLLKIGAVLVALVVVLVVGLVVALRSVPLERIKEALTSEVKNATGRTLTIAGPLKLHLGLTPSVVAEGITLTNPPGSTRPEMVKLERFAMEVALQPLLNKEIVINRVLLDAPDILIETEAKGPGNLDFSRPKDQSQPQPPAATAGEQGAATPFSLTLNEVKLQQGKITWYDRTAKTTEVVALDALTLRPDKTDATLLAVQLATTIRQQQIDLSGTVGRVKTLIDGAPWPVKLKATVAGLTLTVEGKLAEVAAFRGVDLMVTAHGAELGEAIRLAGLTKPEIPPQLGPFAVAARLRDAGQKISLADVDVQAGKREFLLLQAKGQIKDLTGTITPDLALNVESDSPAVLSPIVGVDIPVKGPAKLSGLVRGSGANWEISELKAVVGSSDLAGTLALQLAQQPRLSGELIASSLSPADFSAQPAASPPSSSPKTDAAKGGDGRVFSSEPLPFASLRAVDADLTLQVGRLQLDEHLLTDLGIALQLNQGRLAIKPFRFGLAGGTFEGEAKVDAAGATPALSLLLNGRQFELDKMQRGGPISGGKSDLKVDVKSGGNSVRALMASVTGETVLSVGQGRLRNKAVDWAAGDLLFQVLGAVNPLAKSEDTTQMDCAAVRFLLRDGVATADKGIALRTAKVDVVGSGTVDLRSERLDLGIKPRPRSGVGLSLSTPLAGLVRVNGTLANPSMGIDAAGTLKTAASVGAGIATGGLSMLGELVVDKVASDDDPCRTALGQAQSGTASPKKETKKSSSGNMLQGIFGR
jgi:uncharacterized protein involved in outer membrane biogenesis